MDDKLAAITVVGKDRPGIVSGIAEALYELGCNLEDVTSTILRGHFSMVLVVRVPARVDEDDLRARMAAAGSGLGVATTVGGLEGADVSIAPPTHMVSVYGADHPGIVFGVARGLADRGVNITDLTSRVIGTGEQPVYALMLEVAAPADTDVATVLEGLKAKLGVDVSVRPLEPDVF